VNDGFLPPGFLAIDIARELGLPLFDPELQATDERGVRRYVRVDPSAAQSSANVRQHPTGGAALIGGTGSMTLPIDASIVVAQTSIYVLRNDRALARRIVSFLTTQDYVGGLFVNDRFGQAPGALRLSDVGLMGTATTPKPAVVVNFKSFALDPKDPYMSAVIVGSVREHGQGDHGSLARANTFNNMAAIGPDFKKRFVDNAPVSNADVQPTLAHIMKMRIPSLGTLRGRVIVEALATGPNTTRFAPGVMRSRASDGWSTVLKYQVADRRMYLDEACFTTATTCEGR
jgi:hypothetical protein